MASLLELQDLYNEALVREIIEKTKSCNLTWTHLGGGQFKASEIQDREAPNQDINWGFYVTKSKTGNITSKYTLNIKKDDTSYITIEQGPLPHTQRDSAVKELYEIVEITVLELDSKLKEAMQFIQNIS